MRLQLAYRKYSLPFHTPVRTGHGVWAEREGVLVRLTDEAGKASYGEAAPIPWFGTETVDEIEATLAALGEWVTPEQLAELPARLGCLRFGLAGALAGVLSEASSAKARATAAVPASAGSLNADKAIAKLSSKNSPDFLPVAALLPAGQRALPIVRERAEMGFRTFKWKVAAGDIDDELAILDDVIAELPEGSKLRLDANGAWEPRQAQRWLERAADRPIEFIEQPCFTPAHHGATAQRRTDDVLRGLAEDYPTTLALDESLVGANDVERWISDGWRGVFVIKPSLFGDPAPVLARLAAAKADVVFSSALETAVGARAALEAAFSWKVEKPRALGFGVWPLFKDSVFDGPYTAPFIRIEDIKRLDAEAVWNALN